MPAAGHNTLTSYALKRVAAATIVSGCRGKSCVCIVDNPVLSCQGIMHQPLVVNTVAELA